MDFYRRPRELRKGNYQVSFPTICPFNTIQSWTRSIASLSPDFLMYRYWQIVSPDLPSLFSFLPGKYSVHVDLLLQATVLRTPPCPKHSRYSSTYTTHSHSLQVHTSVHLHIQTSHAVMPSVDQPSPRSESTRNQIICASSAPHTYLLSPCFPPQNVTSLPSTPPPLPLPQVKRQLGDRGNRSSGMGWFMAFGPLSLHTTSPVVPIRGSTNPPPPVGRHSKRKVEIGPPSLELLGPSFGETLFFLRTTRLIPTMARCKPCQKDKRPELSFRFTEYTSMWLVEKYPFPD